ncbi:MAG: hypothetical protein IPI72_06130 [Flavobacteriales bacterium]|nr:hypothetical protein [Flavobacteriales bacterium]
MWAWSLQRWHFPIQEHILLPEGSGAHEHLTKQEYRNEVEGIRMVRGEVMPLQVDMCFAWEWGAV